MLFQSSRSRANLNDASFCPRLTSLEWGTSTFPSPNERASCILRLPAGACTVIQNVVIAMVGGGQQTFIAGPWIAASRLREAGCGSEKREKVRRQSAATALQCTDQPNFIGSAAWTGVFPTQ